MDEALEMTLLFDYYGDLLTERQRLCFDMRHNQDLTLGEIAEELQISRQGVHDNLSRAEALLRNMEEKTGCVSRDLRSRKACALIGSAAGQLLTHPDPTVSHLAARIIQAARGMEE